VGSPLDALGGVGALAPTPTAVDDPICLLDGFPLFSRLPREAASDLLGRLRRIELRCGDALVRQGEHGESLFFVVDGRFEARIEQPPLEPRVIGVVGRGETVGEMAVITAEPRRCSVIATRRSTVLELSGSDFLRVLERHPAELLALTRQIVQRSMQPGTISPIQRVALLPLDGSDGASWLTRALTAALSRFGTTAQLDRDLAIAELGGVTASGAVPQLSSRFLSWLMRQESTHDFVVYEAMHQSCEWTQRCLAQADLVLLVGNADNSPALTPLERMALTPKSAVTLAPIHLVLLRPDRSERPTGTAPWLDARRVALHHHVAIGHQGDVDRLARVIAGRAVKFVFSGGGARGFAAIGVMRALEEAKMPVDFVGGTSMGATMAALRAMEWDAARMHDECRRLVVRRGSVKDRTFPLVSLYSGRGSSRAVRAWCEGRDIEDLPIGYFAVSADLGRAEEVVHRRGPLWIAMRSSASIPGAVPPMLVEGRCLVDGGVLNNLPVDVMARVTPGYIAAIDVSRAVGIDVESARTFSADADGGVSGWRLLLRRLNPFRRRPAPTFHAVDILARALELAAVRDGRSAQETTPIALRIEPPVEGHGMLDIEAIDSIVEAGYAYAAPRVETWRRLLLPGP
jgi:predicted acylesterase/phospholipase RssA